MGNLVLHLPKAAAEGGMTLKFMVGQTDAPTCRFLQPGTNTPLVNEGGSYNHYNIDTVETGWQILYLDYKDVSVYDRIDIMFLNGAAGASNIFYFAWVTDGDTTV